MKKKWHQKGSHSSSVSDSNSLVRLQTCKKKKKKKKKKEEEEEEKKKQTFWPSVDFLVRYFCNAFVPLGVLFVMKTLEDEQ